MRTLFKVWSLTGTSGEAPKALLTALWLLLFLFILRVLGQLLVVVFNAGFLPSEEEWLSGTVGYGWLLPAQILIILLCGKVCIDFTLGKGFFTRPRHILATGLTAFGSVYLGIMVVRYVIRMSLYSNERWAGGSIPIFAHWVLAIFILLVASYHWVRIRDVAPAPEAGWTWRRWLSRGTWVLVGLLVAIGVFLWIGNQLAPWYLARKLEFRPSEFAVIIQRDVALTTSDGIRLVADIYHPKGGEPAPGILVRMPLTKTLKNNFFADVVGRMWAERGYTVVLQGTRGRYKSSGTYYPLLHERQDGIETLRWVKEQPWFNGQLGMWGGSVFGYTQWVLADQVDSGASAFFIQIASTDFHRMFYPGGAFSLESALYWAVRSHGERDITPAIEDLERGFNGYPVIEADDRVGRDIGFFNDWVSHPARDQYWAQIDGEKRAKSLRAPTLLLAGWFDPFLPGMLDDFDRIRKEAPSEVASATRLIIGPWVHAMTVTFPGGLTPRNYRWESLAPSLEWFDQHLKSPKPSSDTPIRIYVMGENVWRDEWEWPLARTQYTPYYLSSGGRANTLNGDGVLTVTVPTGQIADTYVYDPWNPVPTAGGAMLGPRSGIASQNAIESRNDVLVYTTPPLEEDLETTGPITLILYVSTTAPNTDFVAKLVDVHPTGPAYNVSEGVLRRDYQASVSAAAQAQEIEIELWPTSILFLKGHRIRLEVSSSNYPRFDRNPNTGSEIATETQPIAATQLVYHGPSTPSRLVLPFIPR